MDSDEILSDFSDSEIVESKHKNLVETISTLDKKSRWEFIYNYCGMNRRRLLKSLSSNKA